MRRSRARSSDSTASPRPGTEAATYIRASSRSPWPTPSLIPKVAQSADGVVEPDTRLNQVPASGDDGAHAVRRRRLDMHLLVEAGARQLREARGVVRIGLVSLHRLQALVSLPRADTDDRDAPISNTQCNRWGHSAGLDHHALDAPYRSSAAAIAFGVLSTHCVPTLRPSASTTQTCVVSIDRSNPA